VKKLEQFKESIKPNTSPDAGLSLELKAMWYEKAGNWDKAHDLCNEIGGKRGDWVHAYLHRVEGDQWNAGYWYDRAGEKMPAHISLEQEWDDMVSQFLE